MSMILTGDVGGTKTLLGLFEPAQPRPKRLLVRTFRTLAFSDLRPMIAALLEDAHGAVHIDTACFGVAGPVTGSSASITNVGWGVDAGQLADAFAIARVSLLNDLEAMAHSVPVLDASELHSLQDGDRSAEGNAALIAAGTGLGEALLHRIDGRIVPSPSEGGHAEFAARTDREVIVLKDLTDRFGRAEVERVVSGPGLVNIHRALHGECEAGVDFDAPEAPAGITAAAVERRCAGCIEALDVFVEAYGAEAGNLALRSVSTGGVFIGGGIAPRVLQALGSGAFLRAFRSKAPFEALLGRMPVHVILNSEAALLGAAAFAAAQG